MKKCLNCGYERQAKDDQYGIIPLTECPKCHAIYEKGERLLLKKEYEKAEEWLNEKKRGQSRDGNLSDPRSSKEAPIKVMLKNINKRPLIGGTSIFAIICIIFVIIGLISEWQDNNEKKRQAEIQRQEVIAADQVRIQAAEQARIRAEQQRTSFAEEYRRERQKKIIHDSIYT